MHIKSGFSLKMKLIGLIVTLMEWNSYNTNIDNSLIIAIVHSIDNIIVLCLCFTTNVPAMSIPCRLASEREWRLLWQRELGHAQEHASQLECAYIPEPFGCDDGGCCECGHCTEHERQCVHCTTFNSNNSKTGTSDAMKNRKQLN